MQKEFIAVKEIHQELASFKDRSTAVGQGDRQVFDKDVWPKPEPLPTRLMQKKQFAAGTTAAQFKDNLPSWARNKFTPKKGTANPTTQISRPKPGSNSAKSVPSRNASPLPQKKAMKKSTSSLLNNAADTQKKIKEEEEADPNAKPDFEGAGHEKELVEMVKRDILVTSPNIGWKDIAGLREAKGNPHFYSSIIRRSYSLAFMDARFLSRD